TQIVPREPLVQDPPAHAVPHGQLGDGVEATEVVLDKAHSFQHRTGLLPWHGPPPFPRESVTHVPGLFCYLCARSVPSQQPTRGRTPTRRFRASCFAGSGVSVAGT